MSTIQKRVDEYLFSSIILLMVIHLSENTKVMSCFPCYEICIKLYFELH